MANSTLQSQRIRAVAIGASAGALEALTRVLAPLPESFTAPIFIVVHIPADKNSAMASLLSRRCRRPAIEACDKEPILPSTIYLAPPDYHLLVEQKGYLSLSNEEPVLYSRPSIDVLFESAADCYEDALVGVVLTGANSDGSKGLRAIIDAGGLGVVQDPSDAHASAMPTAAITLCPEATVLSLDAIPAFLQNLPIK